MHRSRHPVDITLVVDDDNNDEDLSSQQYTPSTPCDYSSLIVDSPTDTMYHPRTRSPSPSPTSPMSINNHLQGPQPTTSSPSTTTSARHGHRRPARSASLVDLTASGPNSYRVRFNTWPRHRKEKRDILAEHDKRLGKSIIQELGIGINKTYRNPWGNLSYAQLITRAIDSSPWKRLTLNEVYEWIIKFVPYFKDKIDAKTSWGWKNSIRHNLSLHNQFIRVPIISSLSKGPVKYVWTINPSFKNNSPYKKYSLKRKRAAAAAALASQAAAAAAVSNMNSISSTTGSSGLPLSQERHSPSSTVSPSSQPLVNMSNNYHRQSSASSSLPKATRLNEHAQGNSSSTLNQLSMAAAMMSAGITDPAAYRAFLNSQAAAAAMLNKHKQQTLLTSATQPSTSMGNRPAQANSSSFGHEPGLPVPKKVALGADRYKQQQEQHAEWLLNSYRQQQQQSTYSNGRHPHPSESTKMMVNQQRSSYLPPPPPTSSSRVNAEMNNLSPSLQRRVSSPASYSSAAVVAAQNKLLAQTKLWHAAVQAAAHAQQQQQQQQYHHPQQQPPPANTVNELQNYIARSNTSNGNHHKMSSYLSPETLKLLSSSSSSPCTTATPGNTSHDEQHMYSNTSRYKMMRSSYPNATAGSLPPPYLIRQRMSQANSQALTSQQQMEMVSAAYQNYRRRSSGFSSTTSHGGASDDESDEYVPPRKDSSTSNASSGYESGLAVNRQSPPNVQSIRTGSGSSIASEASSSSCYQANQNGRKLAAKRLTKIISSENDIEMDERQQLSLNSVGGYVDDLMERIRKMPPKKRSKFYQMLDEERIKDVNNNNSDDPPKAKVDEADDDEHMSMDVSMPLLVSEVHSDADEDEDERTLSELTAHPAQTEAREERKEQSKEPPFSFNEKSFEELHAMGVPIAVLKAIAYQQSQARKTNNSNTNPLANFLSAKYSIPSSNSPSDTKTFLNARTILRRILQQHQKEQQQQQQQQHQRSSSEKTLVEAIDYTSDEEGDTIDDDDDDERQSSLRTPRHRNGVRSNSHNPGAGALNPNDIASLSPPTSTSSSPDETDVHHQSSPNSLSRPSSTPATTVSSAYSF